MLIETTNDCWNITVPAKVNLFLEVGGKRSDGYHNVDTVMMSVDLVDQLSFKLRQDQKIVLKVHPLRVEGFQQLTPTDVAWDIPDDSRNLVCRALESVRNHLGLKLGMDVNLWKSIPAQAGLGGGSADAAAAIVGGMLAWGRHYDHASARSIAASLGSDINFFIETAYSGFFAARCSGRGEIVDTIDVREDLKFLIVHPPLGCSTKSVFDQLSPLHYDDAPVKSAISIVESLQRGDGVGLNKYLWNRLSSPAMDLNPWMHKIASILRLECGMHSFVMSGSGSAVVVLPQSDCSLEEIFNKLTNKNLFRVYNVSGWRSAKIVEQLEKLGIASKS